GRANSLTLPSGVIRPTPPPRTPTNQRLPSGPAVIAPVGLPIGENSVTWPEGEMRPTADWTGSVNQTLPSGPAVMAVAATLPPKLRVGSGNSVIADGTQRLSRASSAGRNRNEFAWRTVLRRVGHNILSSF